MKKPRQRERVSTSTEDGAQRRLPDQHDATAARPVNEEELREVTGGWWSGGGGSWSGGGG